MEEEKKYCLWEDKDLGEIHVVEVTTPIERCALGFKVYSYRGNKLEMEERKQLLIAERQGKRKKRRA